MTDLPVGWGRRPLSEVLEESIGGIWGSEPGSAEVDVSVLRVTEMKADGRLEPSTAARRSVSAKQVASRELRVGDIILEKSGGGPKSPVGRVGIIDSTTAGYLFSNFMQLLRPATELVQPDFLFQFLVYFQATGQTAPMQTATTNIRNIKMPDYLASGVPLPPLAEQQRIVEILEEQFSRQDDALASVRTVREKAKAFRRSLLQAAFSGSLSDELVKFEPVPLQDLVDAKADITDGPFGSNLKSEHYTTSGPRVVRLANISAGSFINSFAHISAEHFATLQKHRVLAGDVLVATLGDSIPRACIAPEYLGDAIVKADCIRIRPSRRVTPSFLSYAINSPVVRASAASMIQGVTRPRINLGTLRNTVIPLPPLAEQCRITELIEKQFSRLDDALEITNQLELRITSARRSLLHAAFSGTLTAQWRETHNG